jgi:hypothetical protein
MRIGKTSAEPNHQIPYCGPMPLVHPQGNTSIAHGCVPHVIFHKATRLTHGTANLKPAQQSSNGAQTGPKVPPDDTVTDCRGCGYLGKSPELATCPVLNRQSARNNKAESMFAVAERAAPDPSGLPQTTDEHKTSRVADKRMSTRLEHVDDREEVELLDALLKRAGPTSENISGSSPDSGQACTST